MVIHIYINYIIIYIYKLRARVLISTGTVAHKCHGMNKKLTAPTKRSRHEQITHGTRAKLSWRGLETNLKEYKNMADNFNEEDQVDEEGIVRYYFFRGFSYEEIRRLLQKNHAIEVSIRTLKRRIKSYGLRRRQPDYNIAHVRAAVENVIDGHGSLQGYRSVWHTLQLKGLRVPRVVVQEVLREIDPEGTELRRARRLKRREYHNPGPNYSWHCDGYDKLKPYGFPIHGCIDGWSRKILWLYVTRSNNQPDNIATYYLDTVEEFGGCPVDLVTDLGTENGTMAAIQAFFRDDPNSHRYVPSPRNQRIEAWWGLFRKCCSTWWINFFKDLVSQRTVDLTSEMQMECLWFCFAELLQQVLNETKEHWNTHYIRGSRHDTVKGRPDSLYYLPELCGGGNQFKLPVPPAEIQYARSHVVEFQEDSIYQEYFKYVLQTCNLSKPTDWRQALELYKVLLEYANEGIP